MGLFPRLRSVCGELKSAGVCPVTGHLRGDRRNEMTTSSQRWYVSGTVFITVTQKYI